MARIRWSILAGFCLAGVIAGAEAAPQPGAKPVPTEDVIVPPEVSGEAIGERPMPKIPSALEEEEPGEQPLVEPQAPPPGPPTVPSTGELPTVEYDVAKLPIPVRRLREQIIEAASTGDLEKLKPIFEANDGPPDLSLNEVGDPIEYLKSLSGDNEGREILAILLEVLEAGYVHVDAGTPEEMYVWPYFARYPVDRLTPPQIVELFKLIYAGDYEDMKTYGTYLSYRVGITPKGEWKYFLSGD